MSVPAPRAKKPDQLREILRTLTVFDLLAAGLKERKVPHLSPREQVELLKVAQAITARTIEEE